jgi:hypothetical protein
VRGGGGGGGGGGGNMVTGGGGGGDKSSSGMFSGGGADNYGNFGAAGDYFGGIIRHGRNGYPQQGLASLNQGQMPMMNGQLPTCRIR